MEMSIFTVDQEELLRLKEEVMEGNEMKILPSEVWEKYTRNTVKALLSETGTYVIPTEELIDFLDKEIGNKSAIEIGAGNGFIGRELGIPLTDLRIQEDPEMIKIYESMGNPPIKYPDDVEKLEGIEAIKKYKPHTILCNFVTHKSPDVSKIKSMADYKKAEKINRSSFEYGLDFEKAGKLVKQIILVGNYNIHKNNPIMSRVNRVVQIPGLLTRSNKENNRIFIWGY